MKEPKPIDVSKIKRAKSKAELTELVHIKLIPYEEKTKSFIEEVGDAFPFILLQYGKNAIEKLNEWGLFPPPLGTIAKGVIWGIDFAARRYSVKQEKVLK